MRHPFGKPGRRSVRICDVDLAIMLESYRENFVARVERAHARETSSPAHELDS